MPVIHSLQRSFLDLEAERLVDSDPGSLLWLLVHHRSQLFPTWLTAGWRGEGNGGRNAWSAETLLCLLWLRWSEEGCSRLGACRRARTDVVWRLVMGLPADRTPTEKTVREFEAFLRADHPQIPVPRYLLLHEHIVHLTGWSLGHEGETPTWVMDSTPMWFFGAVLDTCRLLGDGLRRLGRLYARATRRSLSTVARKLDLPLLLAKSTKGWLRIDWRDPEARSAAISGLVVAVMRVVEQVRSTLDQTKASARNGLVDLCDTLLRVIEQDLEQDQDGRWQVARRVAKDRIISFLDTDARHGHKSRSESFTGYKLNVLGDAVSGLIAAVSVTPGNGHDAAPGNVLVERVQRMRIELRQILADTAYGGTENRLKLRSMGIDLVAPPPPLQVRGSYGKSAFQLDFDRAVATCPNNIEAPAVDPASVPLEFKWPAAACVTCPLQSECLPQPITVKTRGRPRVWGRRVRLHPEEAELLAARASWQDPKIRELYRRRSTGERLHVQLLQHGARHARAWGIEAANLQAHAIAMRCNLGLLAEQLARHSTRTTRQAA